MAFLAAGRRAASTRLLRAADTTTPSLLLRAADTTTSPVLVTAADTTTSPLLLTAADTTTSPVLVTATAEVRAAATTSPRLLTATVRAAVTRLLLTGAATTTTTATPLAGAVILGTPISSPAILSHAATLRTCFSSPGTIHRRFFSTTLLGDRKSVSTPTYLATAGSRLASRGMTTEALTPVVQKELERMEKASAARHEEFMKELEEFELKIMSTYSAAKLSDAETALTAGKVAWRVSTAVLAFGVTTLVAVLQVVKDGWKLDFQAEVKCMLEEMIEKMKGELLAQLRQLVMNELEVIEAEKAAAAKK